MERLENHIKKTLQKREIKPSARAWHRISTEVEQKKRKNPFFPLGVAASIVGLLILGLRFLLADGVIFKSTPPDYGSETIVETTREKSELEDKTEQLYLESEELKVVDGTVHRSNNEKSVVEGIEQSETETTAEIAKSEYVALHKIEISEEAIAISAQAILAEVIFMEKDSIQITDAEIDSLLLIAQKQLLTERIQSSNTEEVVDATALLNEVELELFESERNQLFDRLRDSFFKLRTAVADRNK